MAEKLKYEISHDLLARQVFARFSAEEKTLRKAERMLSDSYELHTELTQSGEGSRLLNPEELVFLKSYLKQIQPNEKEVKYLEESERVAQEAELAERRRLEAEIERQKQEQARQKRWLTAAIIAGLVMLAIAIFAGISWQRANDAQIAKTQSQDSLRDAFDSLQIISAENVRRTQEAQEATRQAIQASRMSDSLNQIDKQKTLSLQQQQLQLLSRQEELIAEKNRADRNKEDADSARLVAENKSALAQKRLADLSEAQGRELVKLADAVYQLQYDRGFNIIMDASKYGTFNPKLKGALLDLAYYYEEIGDEAKQDSLLEQVAYVEGTDRGGDVMTEKGEITIIEDEAQKKSWQERYFPNMVQVEGGTFWMGDTASITDKIYHQVQVSSFEMSQYEITAFQYELYLAALGRSIESITTPYWGWNGDNPIVNIDWFDAISYCNWLSEKMGYEPVYEINTSGAKVNWEANGYRLPTEAEWEYAAGGGKAGRDAMGNRLTRYAGSNDIHTVAWHDKNSGILRNGNRTLPVGQKTPNALGLYDMSGNVWEWCFDWYGAFTGDFATNPRGFSEGNRRIVKGGSWEFNEEVCAIDYRSRYSPSQEYHDVGFRVVRNL